MRVGFALPQRRRDFRIRTRFKAITGSPNNWNDAPAALVLRAADWAVCRQDAFRGGWACDFTDLRPDHDFYVAAAPGDWRVPGEISSKPSATASAEGLPLHSRKPATRLPGR